MKWQQGNILIFLASWIGYSEKQNTYEMRKGVIFMRTNKKLMLGVLSALMVGATSAYAAQSAEVLYSDVPADHWAVKAITQLNQEGIVTGYGDGTFRGDRAVTRYEMAQLIASARSHEQQANNEQKAMIEKLSAEFSEDLESIGMRVTKLEEKSDNVKVSGCFAQKAMKGINGGNTWWEKELFLNVDGQMTNGWKAHAGVDWKWGTASKGWNGEESFADGYGNDNRDVNAMLYQLNASGPIGKDLSTTFGLFAPTMQDGYVENARIKGVQVDYQMGNTTLKGYTGHIYEKNDDLSSGGGWGSFKSGFMRNGGRGYDRYNGTLSTGQEADNDREIKSWGVAVEHKFDDKVSAGVGYYKYDSPAYLGDKLGIVAVNGSYKLDKQWGLSGFYSHGDQGYQSNAYDLKLTYNDSPWSGNQWGGYVGYRQLGSDAVILSSLVHGSEKAGSKGVEAGLWYRFSPSIVLTNDFYFDKALDDYGQKLDADHTAFFSNLMFTF